MKLSSRKELLSEAENEMKKIRGKSKKKSLNESKLDGIESKIDRSGLPYEIRNKLSWIVKRLIAIENTTKKSMTATNPAEYKKSAKEVQVSIDDASKTILEFIPVLKSEIRSAGSQGLDGWESGALYRR
jgi:hypothetical protein